MKQQREIEGGARLKSSEEIHIRRTCRISHQLNALSVKKQITNKKQRMEYLMQRRKIRHAHDMHALHGKMVQCNLSNLVGIVIPAFNYWVQFI